MPADRLPPALVLTAGLGTRLRPLTYLRAKAALPVNGEPLVRRIIRILAAQGVQDLVLNLHHHPQTITAAVGDGSDLGVRVRYSWENPVLGSAGGPRRALPLLLDGRPPDATSLLVNGDTLSDVSIEGMLERHRRSGAAVTMALIRNPRPDHYGGVIVEDGWVTEFTPRGMRRDSYHFIGVQAVRSDIFAHLQDGVPAESVGTLYRELIRANPRSVAAFVSEAAFRDIGTPGDYLETSLELARLEGDRLAAGARGRISPSARVEHTALWDDVELGDDVHLVRCVVGDRVRVPPGARYTGCAMTPADGQEPGPGEWIEGHLLLKRIE